MMPQSERSEIIKKIAKWLVQHENGQTVQAILHYVKWEITEGGATDSAIKKYIDDLDRGAIIEYRHPFWKVTNYGKKWLERHSI